MNGFAHRSIASVVMAALSAASLAACSAANSTTDATGNPDYVFEHIAALRNAHLFDIVEPDSLADALPNRQVVAQTPNGQISTTWSDLVVSGTITQVQPGGALSYDGIDPTSAEDEEAMVREVDFDDPSADEHNVIVTMRPEWSAGDEVGDEVEIRLGVIGDAEPSEFMAGLRALQGQDVVMVLDTREGGRYAGEYYPIMGGAMIGRISETGELSFVALGSEEAGFVEQVDTIEELRNEAEEPEQVIAP